MRGAKKEVLRLLTTFIERAGPPEAPPLQVAQGFLPPMLDPILGDYHVSATYECVRTLRRGAMGVYVHNTFLAEILLTYH